MTRGGATWTPGSDRVWRVLAPALEAWRDLAYRVRVRGLAQLPVAGPVVVVANHVSFRDPVVLATIAWRRGRRLRALAVEEAFGYPVTGWVLREAGMIPVAADLSRVTAVGAALAALGQGEAVLVYPEGTIPRPGQVRRARPGVGILALGTGAPVVPVATRGLERRRARPRQDRRQPLARRRVEVLVGPPVPLDDLRGEYLGLAGPTGSDRVAALRLGRRAAERSLAAVRQLEDRLDDRRDDG